MRTIYFVLPAIVALAAALLFWWSVGPAQAAPEPGQPAPAFTMQDQHGKTHSLSDYKGKWLVLYFYPKNDTPGCTTEACAFRDDIYKFREMGVEVAGVSLDDIESHQAFAEKYSLPFTLLSDADAETATAYGVLGKMGPVQYAKRQTFIIDPEGRIAKHYGSVNPDEHTGEVVADLQTLLAAD